MELRSFMREKLPEYMIPGLFISLDVLPVIPNGKVDRIALRSLHVSPSNLMAEFPTARNETEDLLTLVWCEVLKIEQTAVHDNFFDLGGHSLLAIRVLARVRDIFQQNISLSEFFEAPTISALARIIRNTSTGKNRIDLPPIVKVAREGSFPLSQAQKLVWVLNQLFPGALFLNMPYAFRLLGALSVEALRGSVQEIVRRHEAFRILFKEQKGSPLQFLDNVSQAQVPVIDLRNLSGTDAEAQLNKLSLEDAEMPFDLASEPPFRILLVHLADNAHVLLVTFHHIAFDHWSMQLFRKELIAIYEAYVERQPVRLPPVPVQMIDYVCWQRALPKRLLSIQLAYWKKRLSGKPQQLMFRKQKKASRLQGFGTATQRLEIDGVLFSRIKKLARVESCTLFMFLVAAINIVLSARTRSLDISVGTPVANRRRPEMESVVGNCGNAVVLRTKLWPNMTFIELLRRVRETTLSALANQDVPFGKVASAVARQNRVKTDVALFQVMFIYNQRSFEPTTVAGLTFAPWEGHYRRSERNLLLTPLDLIFELSDMSTKLIGSVTYKTTTVGDFAAAGMKKDLVDVLQAVASRPTINVSTLLWGRETRTTKD